MRSRVEAPLRVHAGTVLYPAALERLSDDAPAEIYLFGNTALLREPVLGLFCSIAAPGRVVVETYDVARSLARSGGTVAGGFQSPLEREVLDYLLRGSACAIICPGRSLHAMRLPALWRRALAASRLLLLSPFPPDLKRPTAAVAEERNRLVAALASRLLFLHATPGGRLARLARQAAGWGVPMYCLDHPANEDLRVLGAASLPRSAPPLE
jgi:predicted Rossmann fold nucleotide-binding protein DprA/Smf involved in DNA uptake